MIYGCLQPRELFLDLILYMYMYMTVHVMYIHVATLFQTTSLSMQSTKHTPLCTIHVYIVGG